MTNTLSWKDLMTTVLAVVVGLIAYVQWKGLDTAVLSNERWATVLVGAVGLGMCIFGGNIVPSGDLSLFEKTLAALGIIAFILVIAGLIFSSKPIFFTLVGVIWALWLLSTARHALV